MPREVRVRTCHIIIAHYVCGGPAKESNITGPGVVRMQRVSASKAKSKFGVCRSECEYLKP